MPPEDAREFRERLAMDIELGGRVARAVLEEAVRVEDVADLDEMLCDLSREEARVGLAFAGCLHASRTRGGARFVPETGIERVDRLVEAVLAGADGTPAFTNARRAVDAEGARPAYQRLALGALCVAYVGQRHQVIATAISANNN